jgi:hypothetical protein
MRITATSRSRSRVYSLGRVDFQSSEEEGEGDWGLVRMIHEVGDDRFEDSALQIEEETERGGVSRRMSC